MITNVKSKDFNWNAGAKKEVEDLVKAYMAHRKKDNPIKNIPEKEAISLLKDFGEWCKKAKVAKTNAGMGVASYEQALESIADSFRETTTRQ